MKETGTSNEGSKRKKVTKDLLSQYPEQYVGPRSIIFAPSDREIETASRKIKMELSMMNDEENIMVVPLIDSMNKGFDEIPVTKSEARKKSVSKKAEKEEKEETTKKVSKSRKTVAERKDNKTETKRTTRARKSTLSREEDR